jgi:hypothetical protein
MHRFIVLLTLPMLVACEQEPQLTLAEQVKMIATECHELATQQSGGFDPRTAEEPPRTISKTSRRGGEVVGSGAVVRGAAGGAGLGALGGAIAGDAGTGAAAGAAIGGLLGGVRRHRETNEQVTRTYANPDYEQYVAARDGFKKTFDQCMAERAGATE